MCRRFAVLILVMWLAAVAKAEEFDVAKLAKLLSGGDSTERIQAADDLSRLGPQAKAAVPELIEALKSNNTELQWHAASALSAIGPAAKDAVPTLIAALKSEDPMVRGHAANALEEIGEASQAAAPALAALIGDKNGDVRRAAMDALVAIHLKPEVLVPILKQALEDKDMDPSLIVPALNALAESGSSGIEVLIGELQNERARYWATVALAEAGPKAKAAVPELAKMVAAQQPEERMQAAITLGEIGPDAKPAVPQLITALNDPQMSVRYAAAFALGRIGSKDAVVELSKQADSDDHFLKITVAWALAKIEPDNEEQVKKTVGLLVDSLKDPSKHVRAAAARGLYELHAPPDIVAPAMAELLADKDPVVRGYVVDALASLGEKALPRLIKALENDDMQALAVAVIRRLGPKAKDAVPALILELKDPSPDYRREVEFTLGAIGPDAKAAVPALIEMLNDSEPRVAHVACYALGKIGPEAAQAAPALQKNLASDDKFMKVASVWALLHIQPNDKPLQILAVPLLIKALEESDRDLVRQEAANALGMIGPTAAAAIPALEKAAKEADSPNVRATAEEALKKIRAGQ